jgi:hypothetical protein
VAARVSIRSKRDDLRKTTRSIQPHANGNLAWWAYVALALPALVPLGVACIAPYLEGKVPTGFIQSDMPYYMANAREHFDRGFQLTYGNPYAPYGTAAIYSQPHILVLGLLERFGLGPAMAFNLFGLATLCFTTIVAVRFYRELVGLETPAQKLGLLCFFWGGGLLTIAGLARCLVRGAPFTADNLLHYDVFHGWWMFNFGRNLVYPTEAFYHGVALLSLLLLLRRRYLGSLMLSALLSWSHPFAGLTLALILMMYSALELTLKSKAVAPVMLAGAVLIAALHIGYYGVFLNRFADHRALQSQWSLAWLYRPTTFVPALSLVGILALLRLVRPPGFKQALSTPRTRLLLVWFAVVFALSQHNLIAKPLQPIHFTHGYDWMALFFLGAPLLIALFERLLAIPAIQLRAVAVGAVLLVFTLDNITWLGCHIFPTSIREFVELTPDQKAVLQWIDRNTAPPDMVVSEDPKLGYLVSTYTRVRSWYGHPFNTPDAQQRASESANAFALEKFPPSWSGMQVFYVTSRTNWVPPADQSELFHNNSFEIWGPSASVTSGSPTSTR